MSQLSKNSPEWKKYLFDLRRHKRAAAKGNPRWISNRRYEEYEHSFLQVFQKHFKDNFSSLAQGIKQIWGKRVSVFEDGPGEGLFLQGLKKELSAQGVNSRLTSLSVENNPSLNELMRKKVISKAHVGLAEKHVSKEKYNLIFSFAGALSRTLDSHKPYLYASMAHSLKKGGILFAGEYIGGLSVTKEDIQGHKKMIDQIRTLLAHEFVVKDYLVLGRSGLSSPDTIIVIERKK